MTTTPNQPLTTDDIARLAPSALAREASDGMSQRYTYIPTIDVIDGMREAGFLPFRATQSGTRDTSRSEHTKHMIRFRHAASLPSVAVGDSLVEVVLVNSHDGTSSYKLMAGGSSASSAGPVWRFLGISCGTALPCATAETLLPKS